MTTPAQADPSNAAANRQQQGSNPDDTHTSSHDGVDDTSDDKSARSDNATDPQDPALQGEGNDTAARRHRESVEDFIDSGAVDGAARVAAPDSTEEARDQETAEAEGLSHSRR